MSCGLGPGHSAASQVGTAASSSPPVSHLLGSCGSHRQGDRDVDRKAYSTCSRLFQPDPGPSKLEAVKFNRACRAQDMGREEDPGIS